MFPSEVAFLAFGLVLGAAVGGALAQALRGRPAPRREVRLTITPNAIPSGRTRTLAIARGSAYPGVIPGSPDGEAMADAPAHRVEAGGPTAAVGAATAALDRTRVPSVGALLPAALPEPGASSSTAIGVDERPARDAVPVAMSVAVLDVPPVRDPRALGPATLVRLRPPTGPAPLSLPAAAIAVAGLSAAMSTTARTPLSPVRLAPQSTIMPTRPRGQAGGTPSPNDHGPGATTGAQPEPSGPCAGPRRLVDERCALAGVARDQARTAADALHEARRGYDVLRDRVDRAAATADPRRVAAEKDRLHAAFRDASDRAGSPDETEAAARAWLDDLNALNGAVRDAARIIDSGGAELRDALPALERRSAEADAARIAAENAEAGCREAREELAACEEAETRARFVSPQEPQEPHPYDEAWPSSDPPGLVEPAAADLLAGLPTIVRILRGEREARERLVAVLAADDPASRSEWQLRISRLVDAIVGRAIEDGYLDMPEDDPFWRLFEHRESRDIVGALSALGFRYDGLGGFADGHVPTPRDLSLAVGYAGLDRMRIRTWPREGELAALYSRATVASDQWLADEAGDLSLGRMVDALGARAAELADLWNAWGRVRPALLEE